MLPGAAVNVYRCAVEEGVEVWAPQASCGDVSVHEETIAADAGTLGTLTRDNSAVIFSPSYLAREEYRHLDVRKTFRSLAYGIRDAQLARSF